MRKTEPIAEATSLQPSLGRSSAEVIFENLTAGERLRSEYASSRTLVGTFLIELPAQRTVKALALAGFDFLVIDLEHSSFGVETMASLVAEAHACGLPVLTRVWTLDAGLIGKVLDSGANGVLVPRVRSAQEARLAVEAARYGPSGERGLAPLLPFLSSPLPQPLVGDSAVVVVQIEGREAVDQAAQIALVPGLDGIFVGPYDLSQSLGQPGDIGSESVRLAANSVAEVCGDHVMLGIYVHDPLESRGWAEAGFRLQCVGFDGRMLLHGARAFLDHARDGV
jgi:2-keto-3-deoxy-L-rhamnonate aldolase RhmA